MSNRNNHYFAPGAIDECYTTARDRRYLARVWALRLILWMGFVALVGLIAGVLSA